MKDIDDILAEQDPYYQSNQADTNQLLAGKVSVARLAAQNRIKKLNEIGAENFWYVINQKDQRFYNYCRANRLPYGMPGGRRVTIMSQEQYFLFKLTLMNHTAKYYLQVDNHQLLKWGLYK